LSIISRLYAHERPLFWLGILGLALGTVCFAGMAFHGLIVEPEGNLYKAASFDVAVGIFALTLALIVPAAVFTPRGLSRWRWTLIGLTVFGYAVETLQIFRGLDPRFSRVAGPLDQAIGGVFFLSAIGILICFLVLMTRFFFRPTSGEGGALVLALRYGALASLLAFGVGIAMSVHGGPRIEPAGNLLPLHAAGFHGLQAIPLIALLLGWAGVSPGDARRAVHLGGTAWLLACLAIAWQIGGGRSVLEPAPASAAALLVLIGWTAVFLRALIAFRRTGARPGFLAA
jgi:hypothetical protein